MANKTIKFLGYGFSSSPAEVTATADGNVIHTGAVPTLNQPAPSLPDLSISSEPADLFTFDVDQSFVGTIPMTCTVTSGTVVFTVVQVNYYPIPNPVYSAADLEILNSNVKADILALYEVKANPPLSAADLEVLNGADAVAKQPILVAHNLTVTIPGGVNDFGPCDLLDDPRENPVLNGVVCSIDRTPPYTGTWWWKLFEGDVFSYNLDVAITPIQYQ